MDYLKLINNIIETLRKNNFNEIALNIQNAIDYSFISTELLTSVNGEIIKIKKEYPLAYLLIEDDYKKLYNYCISIGIEFKK